MKAATQSAKMDMTGQQLKVNANLNIIGSTELNTVYHTQVLDQSGAYQRHGCFTDLSARFHP